MSNFTAIPNEILDRMADLSPAEFKALMALYRLIIGYKEYRDERRRKLSLNYLKNFTGLSKQGIINAMQELEKAGYISKVEGDGANEWVVNSVDQQGSKLSVPVANSVDQDSQLSVPEVVNSVDPLPLYKEKEKKKEEKEPNPFPFKPIPENLQSLHPPSPSAERVAAILELCGLDADIPDHVRRAEKAAASLGKKYSADYLRHRYAYTDTPNGSWYWYRDAWQASDGNGPTPEQIVQTVTLELKPVQRSNGRAPLKKADNPHADMKSNGKGW